MVSLCYWKALNVLFHIFNDFSIFKECKFKPFIQFSNLGVARLTEASLAGARQIEQVKKNFFEATKDVGILFSSIVLEIVMDRWSKKALLVFMYLG